MWSAHLTCSPYSLTHPDSRSVGLWLLVPLISFVHVLLVNVDRIPFSFSSIHLFSPLLQAFLSFWPCICRREAPSSPFVFTILHVSFP
ncbi:MAG: hypothetical protein BYD32DRAFT_409755 [Podila humilis]|nr:MAG: hypothetical protein BYD32DRAFT_409755 [Podila humilis]